MSEAARFGWCLDGHHSGCPVKIQRWHHGKVREGRKMVDAIIMLDEYRECSCTCHKPEEEKPKKTRARRKK